jgi:hypothetical protein
LATQESVRFVKEPADGASSKTARHGNQTIMAQRSGRSPEAFLLHQTTNFPTVIVKLERAQKVRMPLTQPRQIEFWKSLRDVFAS